MKSFKSLFVGITTLLLFTNCGGDDIDYNPSEQLVLDVAAIQSYLESNNIDAQRDGTGVFYTIDRETNGEFPRTGNIVTVNYELYNFDGVLLDTNVENAAKAGGIFIAGRNYAPFEVLLGAGRVIPGFERALYLLKEGEEGTFYIPSALGYQNQSTGSIRPNENLIFVIETLSIE